MGSPKKILLAPCQIFVHREEHLVTTLLGSCVSVCLFDPATAMGGVSHYMLAQWNGEGPATPKYGDVAIRSLLQAMFGQGCSRARMVAKVFGGANVLLPSQGILGVGEKNIAVAHALLAEEGIPIAAEDVGGDRGRKIICNTRTGVVLMSRLRGQDT